MSPSGDKPAGLVADANVLIDYAGSDKSILPLVSRHIATIYVPSPVLKEVRKLSEKDAASLGIVVVEPTLDQVLKAQAGEGQTSFQDRLCFVIARDAGWSVLTNDMVLRKACDNAGIACVWGMEAMAILVETKHLSAARATGVAKKIAHINSFITGSILERFRTRIGL